MDWMQANPTAFLGLLPVKLSYLWGKSGNPVLDLSDLVLIPFYFIGLARAYRRAPGWQLILAVIFSLVGANLLIGLVYVGGWRYRLVIYPALFLLFAYGLPERWIQFLRKTHVLAHFNDLLTKIGTIQNRI